MADPDYLRAMVEATPLGRNGRDYIRKSYRWDVVLGKYERIFAKISDRIFLAPAPAE